MKAVLALIAIYIATFIIATQGASQNPVQASTPSDNISASSKSIDPVKAADLRTLLEFVGAKDQLKVVANESAAQYRAKLRSSAPEVVNASSTTDRQNEIKAAEATFKNNFDQQRALQQITGIYDKHFSEDEVKGLLDFFSSPLGQKFAAESPKIAREVSAVQSAAAASAARESLRALQSENSGSDKIIADTNKPQVTIQDQIKQISQRP
ncbi:MAG: DUF2059 domain-containing protein [Acidobacteriota bacterium]|nr:DUF2059 domain-containing protein [Acidobacteriota bacterium]